MITLPNRKRDKDLKQRVISAIVLITVVLICVLLSPVTRVLFFAAAGILSAYELSRNLEKLKVGCAAWVMYVYIAVQAVLAVFHLGYVFYVFCFTVGVFLALFSGIINSRVGGAGALCTVAGLAYPCFLFGLLMMISVGDIWVQTLVLACFSTWVCDSFALFGGMRFGKHKVAPLVSPNKTVEGCICGALSAVATGAVIYLLGVFPEISLTTALITCFVASTMGQIGDLAESLIKRMIGVKDFSNLIPGHGGMFDRADSLLFSIPTAYFCLHIAGLGV